MTSGAGDKGGRLPDREFVDSLALKPIDAWTGQEKMRLHNIATLATQTTRSSIEPIDLSKGEQAPEHYSEVGKRNWRIAYWQDQARIWEQRCHEEEKNATQHYTDLIALRNASAPSATPRIVPCCYPEECRLKGECIRPGDHNSPLRCHPAIESSATGKPMRRPDGGDKTNG